MKEDERILNAITPIVNARKTHKDDNLYSLQLNSYQLDMLQGLLDLYEKEKLNSFSLSDKLNKEKEKNKKIEETVKKGMKNLWVDSCAEDAGKYSAYMSIRRILEE